jgi:hypothetical protein
MKKVKIGTFLGSDFYCDGLDDDFDYAKEFHNYLEDIKRLV